MAYACQLYIITDIRIRKLNSQSKYGLSVVEIVICISKCKCLVLQFGIKSHGRIYLCDGSDGIWYA